MNGYKKQSIEVLVATDGRPIPVEDLGEYLVIFAEAYETAAQVIGHAPDHPMPSIGVDWPPTEVGLKELRQLGAHLVKADVIYDWKSEPVLYPVTLTEIERRNPLSAVLEGMGFALCLAAILSGGKITVKDVVKVELPPLGRGIRALKDALRADRVKRGIAKSTAVKKTAGRVVSKSASKRQASGSRAK